MSKNKTTKKKYKELVNACIEAINNNCILFIHDISAYVELTRTEFCELGLDREQKILDAIENSRSIAKRRLTEKWLKSDSPTLNIALYKLISTPEERLAISGKNTEEDDNIDTKKAYLESLEMMNDESD